MAVEGGSRIEKITKNGRIFHKFMEIFHKFMENFHKFMENPAVFGDFFDSATAFDRHSRHSVNSKPFLRTGLAPKG